jgi:subtilisin family serine protease
MGTFRSLALAAALAAAPAGAADRVLNLGVGRAVDPAGLFPGAVLPHAPGSGDAFRYEPHSFVPDDPLYAGQWHLEEVNIEAAWDRGYSGAGVTIGIVDDGVQVTHPDLNLSLADSYDFVDGDADPSPTLSDQNHGTAVAGVAAAAGGNGLGVASPAYAASIAGLKVGFGGLGTSQQFVDATLYRSAGPDPAQNTIHIKNHSYGIAAPYIDSTAIRAEVSALRLSAAAGTLHVLSAGNDGGDANWKRLQATEDAIVVSATADDGALAWYSNIGANITVTAPSSGGAAGITTTDRTGADGYDASDYTTTFNGTSAAAPLVAGIFGLAFEANPNMDSRVAKHLLARTSTKVDPGSSSWMRNAAGVDFSPQYGFGMIDAGRLTEGAGIFTAVTERVSRTAHWDLGGGVDIVERPAGGQEVWGYGGSFTVGETVFDHPVEEVVLTVSAENAAGSSWTPNEMAIAVIDPYGNQLTAAYFTTSPASVSNLVDWNYVINGFWGVDPAGEWLVVLGDGMNNGQTGTLTNLSMTFHTGSVIPEPATAVLALLFLGGAAWLRRLFRVRRPSSPCPWPRACHRFS